ncbi:MAG: translation initiation factor IF-2 [Omnitrophica WOR_2 bacterium RIFCSPHIGHO2_02_FULL_45_21]|nr:MAG: translation initiation factor IF-2 [Omnitrophica WOR_2 bacterium RIFCSPHIGHO2_02_FULL_45_21]
MLSKEVKVKAKVKVKVAQAKADSVKKKPQPQAQAKTAAKPTKPKAARVEKAIAKPRVGVKKKPFPPKTRPVVISPGPEIKLQASVSPVPQGVSAPQTAQVLEKPKRQEFPAPPITVTPAKEELRDEPLSKVVKEEAKIIGPSTEFTLSEAEGLSANSERSRTIEIDFPIPLKDLALKLGEKPVVLIKKLLDHKIIAHLNFAVDGELARKIASEYGCQIKRKPTEEELLFKEHEISDPAKLKPRPPIVTFMGHVDHGKTSLLDAIRKSKVAESEYGGITQHIGAYSVSLPKGKITFLDTPGHEAFTAMRARGAKVTDIVVLVVAADDGIMPQTVEAIDHAKDAQVPLLVAINKIDKPQVNIDLVKKQLSELGLTPEDWGGKTITVGVSARTGEGIDNLLAMILLEAEMLELKADPEKLASGVVLEAKVSEGRGTVAALLVENGTLRPQDAIIAGPYFAKVRAMFNEFGKRISEAPPSMSVEVLGLPGLPEAGEKFFVFSDEKKAKELASKRKQELRERELKPVKTMSLEDLSDQIKEGKVKELKLIIKADVGGSLEAINESLKKLATAEVKLNIIHEAVGSINVSDVILAEASGAIILGFHVETDERSKAEVDKAGIDIRTYNVIYELFNDLKTAMEGLLEPKLKKIFLGRLIVRQVFKLSKSGTVAGCYVEKGKIARSSKVSIIRNGASVFEGSLQSLKRFKDDVREVSEGLECGVSLAGFSEVMAGDVLEAYDIEKIARKL